LENGGGIANVLYKIDAVKPTNPHKIHPVWALDTDPWSLPGVGANTALQIIIAVLLDARTIIELAITHHSCRNRE